MRSRRRQVAVERIGTAAKTYLSAIGASAIYVAIDHGKPISAGAARDLDKALRHLQRIVSPGATFGWVAWSVNYGELVQIAQAVTPINATTSLPALVVEIEAIAQVRGLALTPHARALERAETYAGYLDQAIASMQRDGTLGAFNLAYKTHRLALRRKGEAAQPYWAVMQELRAVIIRSLIAEPKNRLVPASVIKEIRENFPWFARPSLLPKRAKVKSRR
jgi:hypothetical protein